MFVEIALKSCHGKYLCAEADGKVVANRDACKEWETFTLETLGMENVIIVLQVKRHTNFKEAHVHQDI